MGCVSWMLGSLDGVPPRCEATLPGPLHMWLSPRFLVANPQAPSKIRRGLTLDQYSSCTLLARGSNEASPPEMRRSPRFLVTSRLPLAISDLGAGASFMNDVRESLGPRAMVRKHLLSGPVDEPGDTLWSCPASRVDKPVDNCGQASWGNDQLCLDLHKRLSTGCG